METYKRILDAVLDGTMGNTAGRPEVELMPGEFYRLAEYLRCAAMEDTYMDRAERLAGCRHMMFTYRGCVFWTLLREG